MKKLILLGLCASLAIAVQSTPEAQYSLQDDLTLQLNDGASDALSVKGAYQKAKNAAKKAVEVAKKYYPKISEKALEMVLRLEDVITPKNVEKLVGVLAAFDITVPDEVMDLVDEYQNVAALAKTNKNEEKTYALEKAILKSILKAAGDHKEDILKAMLKIVSR
jgi:hypothetical protein